MKRVPAIVIWAVAFAYVESAIVEYLRALYYPLERGGFQFPVLTLERLQLMGEEHVHRLFIELGREIFTIIMLAAVGIAAAENRRQAWAYFMISFGVWDTFFYLWLKLFIDWPQSLMTWDLLFLVPGTVGFSSVVPGLNLYCHDFCWTFSAIFRARRTAAQRLVDQLGPDNHRRAARNRFVLLGL